MNTDDTPTISNPIVWHSTADNPEPNCHFQGSEFVNILIAWHGEVWPGDYTNGRFHIVGVEVSKEDVTAWSYYPRVPATDEIVF